MDRIDVRAPRRSAFAVSQINWSSCAAFFLLLRKFRTQQPLRRSYVSAIAEGDLDRRPFVIMAMGVSAGAIRIRSKSAHAPWIRNAPVRRAAAKFGSDAVRAAPPSMRDNVVVNRHLGLELRWGVSPRYDLSLRDALLPPALVSSGAIRGAATSVAAAPLSAFPTQSVRSRQSG